MPPKTVGKKITSKFQSKSSNKIKIQDVVDVPEFQEGSLRRRTHDLPSGHHDKGNHEHESGSGALQDVLQPLRW